MRLKSELYEKEQTEIINNIINILELDEKNSTTLYHIDNNKEKQEKLINLIPIIRKYFNYTCIKGVRYPEKVQRPYMSIIRCLTKLKYNIKMCDCKITDNDKLIRTTKYIFFKKDT